MTELPSNTEWVKKLHIEFINEEDGSGTIRFEWDETDPELQYWNDLGEEGQQEFIMNALTAATSTAIEFDIEETTNGI